MKIGIIIGSIRDGRFGASVAQWVAQQAAQRTDAEFVTIDLLDFDLPMLTSATLPAMANKQYDSPAVTAWSAAIDACDGFIFVTPEYNHSVPGPFKNAVDSLGPEWNGKTVAFVSYGADNGVRAVEHWRTILANFHMHDVRTALALSIFADRGEDGFAPSERREGELANVLKDLVSLTTRLTA